MKYFNRAMSLLSLCVFALSANGMEDINKKKDNVDNIGVGVGFLSADQAEKLKLQQETEAKLKKIKEDAERKKEKDLKNFRVQKDLEEAQKIEEVRKKAEQDFYELEQKQIKKNIAPSLNELEDKIARALAAQKLALDTAITDLNQKYADKCNALEAKANNQRQEFQNAMDGQKQEYTNKCNALDVKANNQRQQIDNLNNELQNNNKSIKDLKNINTSLVVILPLVTAFITFVAMYYIMKHNGAKKLQDLALDAVMKERTDSALNAILVKANDAIKEKIVDISSTLDSIIKSKAYAVMDAVMKEAKEAKETSTFAFIGVLLCVLLFIGSVARR